MMSSMRLTWPQMRRYIEDYPALATLIAIFLISLVPFIQYQSWAQRGIAFGEIEFERGEAALKRGSYRIAIDDFYGARSYYKRPLFFDHPQTLKAELRLARISQRQAAIDKNSSSYYGGLFSGPRPCREVAVIMYSHLMDSGDYHLEGLTGLVTLRDFLVNELGKERGEDLKKRMDEQITLYANEASTFDEQPALKEEAARYYYLLGEAYVMQGNFEEAETVYAQARTLSPANEIYQEASEQLPRQEAEFTIARYIYYGGYQRAFDTCEKLLAREPQNLIANYCLAEAYRELRNYEKSAKFYETSLDLSQADENLSFEAARHYDAWGQEMVAKHQLEIATQAYQRAAQLAPKLYAKLSLTAIVTLTISGDVQTPQGQPVAGAVVRINDQEAALTDVTGHFTVTTPFLSTGQLPIEIESAKAGFYDSNIDIIPGKTNYAARFTLDFRPTIYQDGQYLPITAGQTIESELKRDKAAHIYVFNGTAGEQILLNIKAEVDYFYDPAFLELWNRDNTRLASTKSLVYYAPTKGHIVYRLPYTGIYYAVVTTENFYSGRHNSYELHLTPTTELTPDDDQLRLDMAHSHYTWGKQQAAENQLEAAMQAFEQAYALDPNDPDYAIAAAATMVTLNISGDVKTPEGEMLAGGTVFIQSQEVAITDQTGHFEVKIPSLSVGQLSIKVEAPDGSWATSSLDVISGRTNYSITFDYSPFRVAIYDHASTDDISYFAGGNANNWATFKEILETDPEGRFPTVAIITDLSASTLDQYNRLILPDNGVPNQYLADVEGWFKPGKKIIAVDSAVSYLAFAGLLWPQVTGENGLDRFWEYSNSYNRFEFATDNDITAGYSEDEIIEIEGGQARLYDSYLPPDATKVVFFRGGDSRAGNVVVATRDVPNQGTVVFLGFMPEDSSYRRTLTRNADRETLIRNAVR